MISLVAKRVIFGPWHPSGDIQLPEKNEKKKTNIFVVLNSCVMMTDFTLGPISQKFQLQFSNWNPIFIKFDTELQDKHIVLMNNSVASPVLVFIVFEYWRVKCFYLINVNS